jgi:hypothetical protein
MYPLANESEKDWHDIFAAWSTDASLRQVRSGKAEGVGLVRVLCRTGAPTTIHWWRRERKRSKEWKERKSEKLIERDRRQRDRQTDRNRERKTPRQRMREEWEKNERRMREEWEKNERKWRQMKDNDTEVTPSRKVIHRAKAMCQESRDSFQTFPVTNGERAELGGNFHRKLMSQNEPRCMHWTLNRSDIF